MRLVLNKRLGAKWDIDTWVSGAAGGNPAETPVSGEPLGSVKAALHCENVKMNSKVDTLQLGTSLYF